MGLTVDQAKDLIRFARDAGLRRLRFGDLEIEFASAAPLVEETTEGKKTPEQIDKELRDEEDDLLFASSGA